MKNWFSMNAVDGKAEVTIYDEIGWYGVTAKDFRQSLMNLGKVDAIDLRINSPGGSVVDGFAIYNVLQEHPATITAHIDGWAASMASIIAMAADKIVMPANTWMMIHNPWTVAIGNSGEMRKMADILDSMKNHAVRAYRQHATDLSDEDVSGHMDAETWMDGTMAVGLGYADELAGEIQVAATLTATSLANAPAAALVWAKEDKPEPKAEEKTDDVPETVVESEGAPDGTADVPDTESEGEAGSIGDSEAGDSEGAAGTAPPVNLEPRLAIAYDEGYAAGAREAKAATDLVETRVADLQCQVEAANKRTANVEARLARLLPGMVALDVDATLDCIPWAEALAKCDGNYESARKRYPDSYAVNRRECKANRIITKQSK